MFKCDLCRDRLAQDQTPYCIEACPRKAMQIGKRKDIFAQAEQLKQQYSGDIYGAIENGGTSTLYVSDLAFSEIDDAIVNQLGEKQLGHGVRMNQPTNMLEKQKTWAFLTLIAPAFGIIAALNPFMGKEKKEHQS